MTTVTVTTTRTTTNARRLQSTFGLRLDDDNWSAPRRLHDRPLAGVPLYGLPLHCCFPNHGPSSASLQRLAFRSYATDASSSDMVAAALGVVENDNNNKGQQVPSKPLTIPGAAEPSESDHDKALSPSSAAMDRIDPQVLEFIQSMEALMHKGPQSLQSDRVVVQVLEDSWNVLKQQHQQQIAKGNVIDGTRTLTESMQQLLDQWRAAHIQNGTQPKTSRPFEILLDAWSMAASAGMILEPQSQPDEHDQEQQDPNAMDKTNNPGIKAMQVLQGWYELLAGDLELKPDRKHYNLVLRALAKVSTNMVQQAQTSKQRPNQAQLLRQQRELVSLASEASEVVHHLEEGGFSVAPTMESYSHLVRCFANILVTVQPNSDNKSIVDELKIAWIRLEASMTDGVEALASKRFTAGAAASPMFTFDSSTRKDDPEALYFYTMALCDALTATKSARDINRRRAKQNQLPVGTLFVVNEINGIHDERLDGMERWQRWGSALVKNVLERPERMASLLQYEQKRNSATNINNDFRVPEIYRALVAGCDAWQNFLHEHLFTTSKANQGVATLEIHRVLECLEGLSQGFDKNQQVEAYVALLRCYLWTIKALEATPRDRVKREPMMQMRNNVLHRWMQKHQDLMAQYDATVPEASKSSDNPQGLTDDRKSGGACLANDDSFRSQQLRQFAAISSSVLMGGMFQAGKREEVNAIWRDMRRRGLPLDANTYGVVLKTLADSKMPDAAPNAHNLLKQMKSGWGRRGNSWGDEAAGPINANHYASVLVAWSRSTDISAPQRALEVFSMLHNDYKVSLERGQEEAMSLQPKPIHFTLVLNILARFKDGNRLESFDSSTVQIARKLIEEFRPEKRTAVACSAALLALLRVATLEAAQLSQILIDDMQRAFERTKDYAMRPMVFNYANCMHTWARAAAKGQAKDAHERNRELLLRLESDFIASGNDPNLLPNNVVYLALADAIASTNQIDAGDQLEQLMMRMLEKAALGQAEPPSCRFYNEVIDARAASAGPQCGEKAEAILQAMKDRYYSDGIAIAKPTTYTYVGVIRAWSRGINPDKAVHAERLLAEMQDLFRTKGDLDVVPDPNTYTAVLHACVRTPSGADAKQRANAVRIALQTLIDRREHLQAGSPFLYNLALEAVHRNVANSWERSRIASALFQQCCEEGLVDAGVLRGLKECSPDLYAKIPGDPKAKQLPPQWTRNATKTSKTDKPQRLE